MVRAQMLNLTLSWFPFCCCDKILWSKPTYMNGFNSVHMSQSTSEGSQGGNSSRNLEQKYGGTLFLAYLETHTKLAFLVPPTNTCPVAWAFSYQLAIKIRPHRLPSYLSDLGDPSVETPFSDDSRSCQVDSSASWEPHFP